MAQLNLKINGKNYKTDIDPETPLLWYLREHADLVGTKYGCGIAQCGACTVHMDGNPIRSCVMPISAIGEAEITTIEGLSTDGSHPVQQAWDELDVPQCGYCQAGQMMTAAAFIRDNKAPSEEEIEDAMNPHICRCGTYHRIRKAVKLAADKAK
ncbi:(2Fe-2S)-binding protein [Marinilongibacter aquaticus]|uniref:(2Fe-2S)-binding protein n=1 Tax=Marinilongibacter aquaticus TaxID=2975157 RepID=UPI0021BD6B75|nr:(2Fe-2S)-binding protein [Marinilongibacter aquaticus]UBM58303.1 (2Fe-2S)-binding protein [Marinilongibacter aquaticus]